VADSATILPVQRGLRVNLSRRELLALPLLSGLADNRDLPAVRAITRGPKFHWFGYYDKLQFDPSGTKALGMSVGFEGRSPKPDDEIELGVIHLTDRDRWEKFGSTNAWCWQQGCMLQWRPGSNSEIVYNVREEGQFACRIHDVAAGRSRSVPEAIYALSPDGRSAVAADFRRLQEVRPGYGYAGVPDPHLELAPTESGIRVVDLVTGVGKLVLSVAAVAKLGTASADTKGAKHWFNHLLYNPTGTRFVFLHRWRPVGKPGFRTRMVTANPDGSDPYILDASGYTSHFIWRDAQHILAWTRPTGKTDGFYLFRDRTATVDRIGEGVMTENGHCTYLPGNKWILNDTYPDKQRLQHVYLFEVATGRRVPLGSFRSGPEYAGEWRCDTHPRFAPDGRQAVIDSPHAGGRQMYCIDLRGIV
jgi:hypothetical protein